MSPAAVRALEVEDPRWQIVLRRDAGADGAFFYAVKTTGVYCRPGCSSRLPKRANVEFFNSPEEAQRAGYRPCRKCKPELALGHERNLRLVEQACRRIEQAEEKLALSKLAATAAMSPGHFQRLFKRIVGVTPKQYAAGQRTRKFRATLENGDSVTGAIYSAGYGSSSRAYEGVSERLGMSPSQFKNGGRGQVIGYAIADCYLGSLLVASTAKGICTIEFGDDRELLAAQLRKRFPKAEIRVAEGDFASTIRAVVACIEDPAVSRSLPLDIQGTAFQQRVWTALREIAPGQTASYAEIARSLGRPKGARAVAAACAANTLAVAVPCHRVVGTNGDLRGYRWGVERKRQLLRRESAASASTKP
jgi:AraC family transcriptional regulator of adaptative response/methylated-DNA-[protein]-cysteine methyltransferase